MTFVCGLFIGLYLKNFYLVGGIDFWWGENKRLVGVVYWGDFPGAGIESQ